MVDSDKSKQNRRLADADVASLSPEDLRTLVHELQAQRAELVHQVETLTQPDQGDVAHDASLVKDELKRLNETLERRVAARVLDLQNKQYQLKEEISRRRISETSLRDAQAYNSTIIDTAQVIILVLDLDGKIIQYNHYLEKLTGRPLEETRRLDWFDTFTTPERARQLIDKFWETSPGERRRHLRRYPIVTRTGEERDIEWSGSDLCNSQGEKIGRLYIGQDITERLHAEEELAAHEQQLSSIVETAHDAIITHGKDGNIIAFNPAAERMFGYAAEEVIGKNLRILMPSPYREHHDEYIARYLETGDAKMIGRITEMPAIRKDGSLFWVELSINELVSLGLFTGFLRDISERKQLQQRLLTIADEQQRRVGQYLHDDLGQVLAGLKLSAETLMEQLDPTTQSGRVAATIMDGTRDALERVRAISRGLITARANGRELIASLDELTSQIENDMLRTSFHYDQEFEALGKEAATQLYHIAQEAISNALKHAGASRLRVSLDATPNDLKLIVEDDGSGYRPKASSGSGIVIMKDRASLIGATLAVRQRKSGGTEVVCTLPRRRLDPADETVPLSGL